MENKKIKSINLVQSWCAGKIQIGTTYNLCNSTRKLILKEDEDYPNGKFVFDDGELFDIGKYTNCFFKLVEKEMSNKKKFDETVWDKFDSTLNANNNLNPNMIKTIGIETVHFPGSIKNMIIYEYKIKQLVDELQYYGGKFVLKRKRGANEKKVSSPYPGMFRKKKKTQTNYEFSPNVAENFYFNGDAYLQAALTLIDSYDKKFQTALFLYQDKNNRNKRSMGYIQDNIVKTQLAFACEMYLKSILYKNNIRKLDHGLVELFNALDMELSAEIYDTMIKEGYPTGENFINNNLEEQFMLDLGFVDNAFVNSRYNAENDKSSNYTFLFKFCRALKQVCDTQFNNRSSFNKFIEQEINIPLKGMPKIGGI